MLELDAYAVGALSDVGKLARGAKRRGEPGVQPANVVDDP